MNGPNYRFRSSAVGRFEDGIRYEILVRLDNGWHSLLRIVLPKDAHREPADVVERKLWDEFLGYYDITRNETK